MYNKDRNIKVDSVIPKALEQVIMEEAIKNSRSRSQQICYILNKYYGHKINGKGNISDVHDMERSSDT